MGAAPAAGLSPPAQPPARPSRSGRAASAIGNLLLTLAAIGGGICILAVLAAWIFKITLIMFSTGSMSPTIPTGSVAIVRQIPAAEVRIGDVVTVDRPGKLPVTHRVRKIEPGPADSRVLTLRGDANASDDAEPYPVGSVRRVMFSIPGVAGVIVMLSDPWVLGSITVVMAGLVLWAFWPRTAAPRPVTDAGHDRGDQGGDDDGDDDAGGRDDSAAGGDDGAGDEVAGRHRAGGAAALSGVLLLIVLAGVLPARPADAAVSERVIRGSVITLTTIGDEAAMTNLQPGLPVHWQVGIDSDPPDPGTVDLSVLVAGPLAASAAGLHLSVSSCPQRWQDGHCPAGGSTVLPPAAAVDYPGGAEPAGSMPAGEQRWLLVRAWLPADAAVPAGRMASVRIGATGFGDSVVAGPGGGGPAAGGGLSNTGISSGTRAALLAGVAALFAGSVLVGVGRRNRRGTG